MVTTETSHASHTNQEGVQRGSEINSETSQVQEHTPSQLPTSGSIHSPTKSEDLWTCRRCGWTYPNAHPSAKHRRNHKKNCGKHKGTEQGHSKSYSNTSNETSSEDESHVSSEHENGKHRLQNLNDTPSEHNSQSMSREIEYLEVDKTAEFQAPPVEESHKVQNGGLPVQPQDLVEDAKLIERSISTAKMADEKGNEHQTFLEESIVPVVTSVTREDDSKTFPDVTSEPGQDFKSETGDKLSQSHQMTEEHLSEVADKEWTVTETSEENKIHNPKVIENASVIAEGPSNKQLAGSKHEAPEDLWTCRYCGWTYPNSHPSAKHRRNHKKHCGKLKGFERNIVLHEPANGSSDDASSDDESHSRVAAGGLSGIGSQESLQKENTAMTLAAVTNAVLDERQEHDFSGEGLLQESERDSETKEGFENMNGEIASDDLHSGTLQPLEQEFVETTDESLIATPQEDSHPKAEFSHIEENTSVAGLVSGEPRNLDTMILIEHPHQTSEKNSLDNGDQVKELDAEENASTAGLVSGEPRNLEPTIFVERPSQTSEKNSLENGDQMKELDADIGAHISTDEHPYNQENSESRSSEEIHTPQLWEQLLDAELEKNKPRELEDTTLHEALPPSASEIQEIKHDLSGPRPKQVNAADLYTCRRCGWTYPNPHPSAKHRRNHKKHCGKLKGFETKVAIEHALGSSDDASSDDESHPSQENALPNVLQDDSHVVQPMLPAPASFIQTIGDTSSSEITAEPVQGDNLNGLLIQNTDAHSSQSLDSQNFDGSKPRTLEQAQSIDSTAGAGTRKLEELPADSNWAVFESSKTPENSKTTSDARMEEQKHAPSANASSIEMDTMQNVDELHDSSKHHTSLQLLFSEDFNKSQSKQEEIVPSADRSSLSSKGNPFVRKVLGRVLSSSAELATSVKPAEGKPRTKPKWGVFVCCSAVN